MDLTVKETGSLDVVDMYWTPTTGSDPIQIGQCSLGFDSEGLGSWNWSPAILGVALNVEMLEAMLRTLREIPVPPIEVYNDFCNAQDPPEAATARAARRWGTP